MAHDLKDLSEVMEAHSAGRLPSPDLLATVRRRVRRNNRLRLAAGAAGTAIAIGAGLTVAQHLGQVSEETNSPMTGVPNDAFLKSSPKEGMRPLREVRYSMAGRKARLTFTPTGPNTMITPRCAIDSTVYEVGNGDMASGDCGAGGATELYLRTKRGIPVTFDFVALPHRHPGEFGTVADLDRYLTAHPATPASWSVRVYSGRCDIATCADPPRARPRSSVRVLPWPARTAGK
jgi:hypothetical protein